MTNKIEVELQIVSTSENIPEQEKIKFWVAVVIERFCTNTSAEVCVRIVDEEEGRDLNKHYCGLDKPTNVLAFPTAADLPLPLEVRSSLGDIVICAPVVEREALAQCKETLDHWFHLVVHGSLHLLGYDHDSSQDAEQMEAIEQEILASYGVQDPYLR